MMKCNCGKEFETQRSLNSHARFCELYVKKDKKSSIYKKEENLYECECGKIFNKSQGLNAHFSHCLIHRKGKLETRKWINDGIMCGWGKFSDDELKLIKDRANNTLSERFINGEIIPSFLGQHHTKETLEKLSIKQSINYSGGWCKWYDYIKMDGSLQRLQGTWELKFAKHLDIIDSDWLKIGVGKLDHTYIWYDEEGYKRRYTPDFWCPGLNKYFEIKGYWTKFDRLKMKYILEHHNLNIEMVEKEQMKLLDLL